MMLRSLLFVGLIFSGLGGCNETNFPLSGTCTEALRSLPDNPTLAADAAVKSGDIRLIAINDYSQWTPGALDPRLREKHGLIVLKKTSDTPRDSSCEDYQKVAMDFAEQYNRRVLEM